MHLKIHFSTQTVKQLNQHWQLALKAGQVQLVKRITALQLLADRVAVELIAQRLGVAVSSVYKWLAAFMHRGFASLVYHKPVGRPARLNQAQKQHLYQLVVAGPLAAGYESGMWNGAMLSELIAREWGHTYHPRYVPVLLQQLGLSYQKARWQAAQLDEEYRQTWLNQIWPTIVEQARATNALLLFGDEASFAQWGSLSYTWAVRGQQPIVKTCGLRRGYKVFGLVDYFSGQLFYQAHQGRFSAESYCAFLEQLLSQTHRPIILIQDGARYHTARATRQFMAQYSERLTVYQLPSYSPDFNPIEKLWRKVKRQATHNHYFENFEALVASVEKTLQGLQHQPDQVKQTIGSCLDALVNPAA